MNLRILILIIVSLSFANSVAVQTAKPIAAPQISPTARFRSLDGKTPITLTDYRGKVVVLLLWASWCGPCRMALSECRNLTNEFRERDVEVVGLSVEKPESAESDVKRIVASSDINYKLGWIGEISALKLMAGRDAVPQLFVIKDGIILKRFVGWNQTITPTLVREAIKENLPG